MTLTRRGALTGAAAFAAGLLVLSGAAQAEPIKIGIANFGEHPQLQAAIDGFKQALTEAGMAEGKDVTYTVSHTNFDATIVPQMLAKLKADNPKLIFAITTPVAQMAKKDFTGSGIPVVFGAVTDPVAAKLVPAWDKGDDGMSGASDLQDLKAILTFTKKLMPNVKTVGVPYNPGEANDVALLELITKEAAGLGLAVTSVAVDNVNDIAPRIASFKGKADVIYNPTSNLLQPATPAVAAAAREIGVPVINASEGPVQEGIVLASFSVNYKQVGLNAGKIAVAILKGADAKSVAPSKPAYEDHAAMISQRVMDAMGMKLPAELADCNCVVK
jgi:putative tryptophan/tyrosine transport system substrate-binding protein